MASPAVSFAEDLERNHQTVPVNNDIQFIKFISPFKKEDVQSIEKWDHAYGGCAENILSMFPKPMREEATISRTFTTTTDGINFAR